MLMRPVPVSREIVQEQLTCGIKYDMVIAEVLLGSQVLRWCVLYPISDCHLRLRRSLTLAFGVPQPAPPTFGVPAVTSAGTDPYGQNQILMRSEVHCVAQTPPL